MLSPSERQSGEIFLKAMGFYETLGRPITAVKRTELTVRLANDSRIISLPGSEKTVRCYSGVTLAIVDEASLVADELLVAVTPMLATSRGRLIGLSTPRGRRGWFSDKWHDTGSDWRKIRIQATQCPRIDPEFLASERRSLGELWYKQEYECSFEDAVGQVFSDKDIEAALSDESPLFGGPMSNHQTHDDVLTSDEPLFGGTNNGSGGTAKRF
jgi:hypothetical protein